MSIGRPWLKWVLRGSVGAAALGALAAGGWMWLRPPAVQVAAVTVRDLTPAVQGVGTVEGKVVVQVGPKIAGRLVAVLVDQGDPVETGQVLARLDDAQLRAEVSRGEAVLRAAESRLTDLREGARPEEIAEARATLARAEALLADLRAGARSEELAAARHVVTQAEARVLDLMAGARPGEIEQARSDLAAAEATRAMTERDSRRFQRLYEQELVAAQERDRAWEAYQVALQRERAARERVGLLLAGPRSDEVEAARAVAHEARERLRLLEAGPRPDQVAAARAEVRAAQERLALLEAGPRVHQVRAAEAQLREAQAALALARERLADTVLHSPLDGFVVSRDLEPGATVNPGTSVLKVLDPRTAWVTVYVDERDSHGLTVGDPAEIALRSLPGRTLTGRVARIRRESDRVTEQLPVDVAFDERPPRLTLGEQAEATLRGAGRRGVAALPLAALVRGPDGPGAWTVVDGRLRFRALRLGVLDPSGWVEVVDGPHPGELVVLAPGRLADPANEGRRVMVTRADAPPTGARAGR